MQQLFCAKQYQMLFTSLIAGNPFLFFYDNPTTEFVQVGLRHGQYLVILNNTFECERVCLSLSIPLQEFWLSSLSLSLSILSLQLTLLLSRWSCSTY